MGGPDPAGRSLRKQSFSILNPCCSGRVAHLITSFVVAIVHALLIC